MGSPAHAGIDRDTGRNRRQANGFPRPRGDRPGYPGGKLMGSPAHRG